MKNHDESAYRRRQKWRSGISLTIVAVLTALVTLLVWRWLRSFSQEGFRDYLRSFGPWGWLVLLGLQCLQVFVALIPGELLETAAGFAYGPVWGTLLCYVGVAAASATVFLLVKRFGVKLVEVFFPREKITQLRFLNTERKRDGLVFLLFFIPGTPKDLLTYFIALTDMPLGKFLILTLIALIPSVLSSTVGGHLLGAEKYWGAVILYGVTGILSLTGIVNYNRIIKHKSHA